MENLIPFQRKVNHCSMWRVAFETSVLTLIRKLSAFFEVHFFRIQHTHTHPFIHHTYDINTLP